MSEGLPELPTRWEIELEFVQSLANIQYLNFLAQNNYLADERFLNYLKYLNYWYEPENAKFLVYPNCLHILRLLQNEDFRNSIKNVELTNTLMNDMVNRWLDQEGESNNSSLVPFTLDSTPNSTSHEVNEPKKEPS